MHYNAVTFVCAAYNLASLQHHENTVSLEQNIFV